MAETTRSELVFVPDWRAQSNIVGLRATNRLAAVPETVATTTTNRVRNIRVGNAPA